MARPTLSMNGQDAPESTDALAHLVEHLQAGWDKHDADITDAGLAADVLWGSPYGAPVRGYDELHEIHVRLT